MNIWEPDYRILLSVGGDNSITTASSPSFSGETTRSLVLLSPAGDNRKNCFSNPLDIIQFRNANDFLLHVVCYEERACQLLKFSMSQEVKKGPFAALIIESTPNFFLTYFQKPMGFYLLTNRDSSMGKVWGKTFFRRQIPWTALTEVAS